MVYNESSRYMMGIHGSSWHCDVAVDITVLWDCIFKNRPGILKNILGIYCHIPGISIFCSILSIFRSMVYMHIYQVYDWSFPMPCHMEGSFSMPCHRAYVNCHISVTYIYCCNPFPLHTLHMSGLLSIWSSKVRISGCQDSCGICQILRYT